MKIEIPKSPENNSSKFNTTFGSYGIVVSEPRTPLENETCEQVMSYPEVAKLFFSLNEFTQEITKYNELRSKLDHSLFLFEKSSGLSNKNEIITHSIDVYSSSWYDCGLSLYDIYTINRFLDYDNFIKSSQIYQMVFDQMVTLDKINFNACVSGGQTLELEQSSNRHTTLQLELCSNRHSPDMFELLIDNLNEIIQSVYSNHLYIDDLKADNIVYNPKTNRFMLIDLTCLVNLNQVKELKTTWNKNIFSINDPFALYILNPSKFKPHLYNEIDLVPKLNFYWELITWPNLEKFKSKFNYEEDLDWLLKFSNQFSLGLLLVKLGATQGYEYIRLCAQQIEKKLN